MRPLKSVSQQEQLQFLRLTFGLSGVQTKEYTIPVKFEVQIDLNGLRL